MRRRRRYSAFRNPKTKTEKLKRLGDLKRLADPAGNPEEGERKSAQRQYETYRDHLMAEGIISEPGTRPKKERKARKPREKKPRKERAAPSAPPEFEDNEGFWAGLASVHECNEKTDLYVLPITSVMLWRYITSALMGAVDTMVSLPGDYRYFPEALRALRAAGVSSPWGGKVKPPSFGIYSTVLGQIGTPRAVQSSFGGKHKLNGVPSLLDLYTTWKSSTAARPPSFYAVQGIRMMPDGTFVTKGASAWKNAKPIAVVVTGKVDDIEGFGIGMQDPGRGARRGQKLDQASVLAAALWALPKEGARNLCVLLPPAVWLQEGGGFDSMAAEELRAWGRKELTQQRAYQSFLAPLNQADWLRGAIARGTRTDFVNAMFSPKGKPVRGSSLRSELDKRTKAIEKGLTIRQMQPRRTWNTFFGSLPPLQFWAARFIGAAQSAAKTGGTPPTDAAASYASWAAVKSSLKGFGKDFREVMAELGGAGKEPGKKPAALRMGDLTPAVMGETLFIEDIREGPTYGLYIPARVTITRGGREQTRNLVPPEVLAEFVKQYKTGKSDLYPMILAKVFLINKPGALAHPPVIGEGKKRRRASAAEISRVLKAQARVVSRGRRATWYMAIPSAEVLVPTKIEGDVILVPNPSGQVYMAGKHNIREVSRDLLRVQLAYDRNEPTLKFVMGTPSRPWTSKGAPYLFSRLPLYDRTRQQTYLLAPGEKTPEGVDGYYKAVKNAFSRSRPSRTVVGGGYSLDEGAERVGGTAKGRRRPRSGRVAGKMAYQLGGFYSLARQVIDQQGIKKVRDSDRAAGRGMLYDVVDANWNLILKNLNRMREEEGEKRLPKSTPPPTNPEKPNVELERQVLVMLDLLLKPIPEDLDIEDVDEVEEDVPSNYQLLSKSSTMRPGSMMPVMEDGDPVFEEEIVTFVRSIKNPVRRKGGEPLSSAELIEFMGGTFAPKASTAALREAPARMELLEQEYAFAKPVDPSRRKKKRENILERLFGGAEGTLADLEPDEEKAAKALRYIQRRTGLTREEAEAIEKARLESRQRHRTLTPSGALCQMYRNAVRLKSYKAPAAVTAPGTAWIVMHQGKGGRTRIMSFRNGAHVDCDMVVTPKRSLSFLFGKAVESMVIWMAGKEIRVRRMKGIYTTNTGSPLQRTLWSPGQPLDTGLMLQAAFTSVADPLGRPTVPGQAEPLPLG